MLNAPQLHAAAIRFGIPIPATVVEAHRFEAEASRLLAEANAAQPPDLHAATSETLAAVLEAAVAFGTNDARRTIAQELHNQSPGRIDHAWHAAGLGGILEAFRQPFDDAIARFADALDKLAPIANPDGGINPSRAIEAGLEKAYKSYTAAAADLSILGQVRMMIAGSMTRQDLGIDGGGDNNYPTISLFADLSDRAQVTRLNVLLGDCRPLEPLWWIKLLGLPGVTVRWHGAGEQVHVAEIGRRT